jgi:hypothetical protein
MTMAAAVAAKQLGVTVTNMTDDQESVRNAKMDVTAEDQISKPLLSNAETEECLNIRITCGL